MDALNPFGHTRQTGTHSGLQLGIGEAEDHRPHLLGPHQGGAVVEHHLNQNNQPRDGAAHKIPPRPQGDADAHRGPEPCGGGDAADGVLAEENDPRPQKADGADHPGGDAGGVHRDPAAHYVGKAVLGQHRHQGGGEGHDQMGPNARAFEAALPLKAHGPAAEGGQYNAEQMLQLSCVQQGVHGDLLSAPRGRRV